MPRIAIAVLTLSITTVDVCGFVSPASPVHGGAPWAAAAAPLTVRGLTITPAIDVYPKLPTRELEADAHAGAPPMLYVDGAPLSAQVADVDPFGMVAEELIPFAENIKHLVDSEHPVLSSAAKHFFEKRHGKRFRPTIVMLMSKAVPMADGGEHSETVKSKQAQLGQITEMIHVASLIHDDVLDDADTRRGGDSVHILFSNKARTTTSGSETTPPLPHASDVMPCGTGEKRREHGARVRVGTLGCPTACPPTIPLFHSCLRCGWRCSLFWCWSVGFDDNLPVGYTSVTVDDTAISRTPQRHDGGGGRRAADGGRRTAGGGRRASAAVLAHARASGGGARGRLPARARVRRDGTAAERGGRADHGDRARLARRGRDHADQVRAR